MMSLWCIWIFYSVAADGTTNNIQGTYIAERSPYSPEPMSLCEPLMYAVATRSIKPGDGFEIPNLCIIRMERNGA